MYTARQFGIDRKEGLLKTFMSNDWMHGVLVNYQVDHKVRALASLLLGAEILTTSVALMNFTSKDVSTFVKIFKNLVKSIRLIKNGSL